MVATLPITNMSGSDDYIRIRLPEELKEKFKLYCAIKNVTMSDLLRDYVTDMMNEVDLDALWKEKMNQGK
jgi:antitoxin component of RelBE/YafQ-DinJ toxin-antitoxin module